MQQVRMRGLGGAAIDGLNARTAGGGHFHLQSRLLALTGRNVGVVGRVRAGWGVPLGLQVLSLLLHAEGVLQALLPWQLRHSNSALTFMHGWGVRVRASWRVRHVQALFIVPPLSPTAAPRIPLWTSRHCSVRPWGACIRWATAPGDHCLRHKTLILPFLQPKQPLLRSSKYRFLLLPFDVGIKCRGHGGLRRLALGLQQAPLQRHTANVASRH
mmetsp:Transcript_33602/g.60095  ORF Transcript_33602/g.60095 Transcript_33602/m.60095 type:complete len:214 (+) Transcript_33602:974-1615(+)